MESLLVIVKGTVAQVQKPVIDCLFGTLLSQRPRFGRLDGVYPSVNLGEQILRTLLIPCRVDGLTSINPIGPRR